MNILASLASVARRTLVVAVTALPFVVGGLSWPSVATAHDTEVFFSLESEFTTKPNVLFLLDTSATMWTEETTSELTYVPKADYEGDCVADMVYVTWGNNPDPLASGCSGIEPIALEDLLCTDIESALSTGGRSVFNAALTVSQNPDVDWQAPQQAKGGKLACQGQDGSLGPATYKTNGKGKNATTAGFTFYLGSWVNFNRLSGTATKYRIDIVREVLAEAVAATPGINVGLARGATDSQLSRDPESPVADGTFCEAIANPDESEGTGNGGMIVFPVTNMSGPGYQDPDNPDAFVGDNALAQFFYELGVDSTTLKALPWKVDTSSPDRRIVAGNPCAIPLFTPNARTPLGLTLYESYLYFSQQNMTYGDQSNIGPGFEYDSVLSSRIDGGSRYKSPILPENCGATNYIIILSDGTTEKDNENDQALGNLIYGTGGKCDVETSNGVPVFPPDQGASDCIDDLAGYMQTNDVGPPDGKQTVITHTIGFALGQNTTLEETQARVVLKETAERGGGSFYETQNSRDLFLAFTNIFREILTRNTSFTSPAVAVNAFNRTQNLNDLYVSLFRPDFAYRWNGNVKKYKLESGFDPLCTQRIAGGTTFCIVGVGPNPDGSGGDLAVDGSGFFYDTATRKAHSFWSAAADGADITAGGAASNLPDWSTRKVFTNATGTTGVNLSAAANRLTALKSLPDLSLSTLLGVLPADTLTPSNPDDLIDWLRGKDLDTGETRYDMGDPLHSKPVAVIYGGTADAPDMVLYSLTNDGFMHAIDPDTGVEQWAFIPYQLLGRSRNLYVNASIQPEDRVYGLDGTIRMVRIDQNLDGTIDRVAGDRIYLFFGQRRGGPAYYAVDVTTPNTPLLMWRIDGSQLPGAGESWSTPAPALVKIGDATQLVLIFGGGYDPDHDSQPYLADTTQDGARIFMVNALTGARLWYAGGPGSGANLVLEGMEHSIPGDVRVIDISGDGLADRMYAADLGGKIWRLDIFNDYGVAADADGNRLVEGGLLADVLLQSDGTRDTSNPMRFFYSPDPALVTLDGATFINVAIGSGHRELPVTDGPNPDNDPYTTNWFFSVRDRNVFQGLKSSQYATSCTTTPCQEVVGFDDFVDLTATVDPVDASAAVPLFECPVTGCDTDNPPQYIDGWKIQMTDPGEKVLSESRTFQGEVFFTTYTPTNRGLTNTGCATAIGKNRLYVVSALNASAIRDLNNDGVVSEGERNRELGQQFTIAPEVVFIFPSSESPEESCVGEECRPNPICLVGLESCGPGFINAPVRTFWEQRGID